jgi:hypothetical protein
MVAQPLADLHDRSLGVCEQVVARAGGEHLAPATPRCSPLELLAVHVERDLAGEHEPLVGGQLVGELAKPAEVVTASDGTYSLSVRSQERPDAAGLRQTRRTISRAAHSERGPRPRGARRW